MPDAATVVRSADRPSAETSTAAAPAARAAALAKLSSEAAPQARPSGNLTDDPTTMAASPPVGVPANAAPPVLLAGAPAPRAAAATGATPVADTPTAQLAPALVAFSATAAGGQTMTLRLTPAELGSVQIRIERTSDAPAKVDVTVERSDTLTLLLRDQSQLQRTLDQAGVPPEGRTLSFHLVDPAPRTDASGFANGSQSSGSQGSGSQAGGSSLSLAGQGGEQRSGYGSGGAHAGWTDPSSTDAAGDVDLTPGQIESFLWRRAGVDITA
jgi:flagellar hook-length control protein FliK